MPAREKPLVLLGADIGSTTTKLVALDARTHALLHTSYVRHHAQQAQSLAPLLEHVAAKLPNSEFRMAMSGSGGKAIADYLGIPYMQEVVANSIAIQQLHSQARCAIELGGQDAKMIFFEQNPATGSLDVADMRMNGSCAGGTGAFIDEIAALLQTPVEDLNALAEAGSAVYQISGRCGVYAKTDIQPLLNQGARKADIALSAFHAIAKQTLGGLAQGLDIHPPVVFVGGPLTFNPALVRVFAERLELRGSDIIVPESAETIVAHGAALSLAGMFAQAKCSVAVPELSAKLQQAQTDLAQVSGSGARFFENPSDLAAFRKRHALAELPAPCEAGGLSANDAAEAGPDGAHGADGASAAVSSARHTVRGYLGIDCGSTTTKFVLLGENEEPLESFYANNEGEPLALAQRALGAMAERYRAAGVELEILGLGTTGYGEELFDAAFHADVHMVETVAHAVAATHYVSDASFILDIGGQDMKAIWLHDGVITDILVNEACSSGCGSFLENFANSLGIPTREIADAAFRAEHPAELGSRCTVFMNSSVVTEQRNGKTPDDIMAGLCRSIVENVFTKVIRIANLDSLGPRIVVQGGTFANDAVLAAFEQYVGRPVVRAPYPGLMGAIGAALLAKKEMAARAGTAEVTGATEATGADEAPAEAGAAHTGSPTPRSRFIGLKAAAQLAYTQQSNVTCPFCTNACSRTLVRFGDGSVYVTGNRCERGLVVGDPESAKVRAQLKQVANKASQAHDVFELREKLLFANYPAPELCAPRGCTVGLPRVLALWDNAPFWTTFWRSLGFEVRLSRPSTRALYENGLPAVPSDTVCFPAKLVHGHVRDLAEQKVDRIFMPIVTAVQSENTQATSESMCAVVKGYPYVIRNSDDPERRFGILFDNPLFHWHTARDREKQLVDYLERTFGISADTAKAAIQAGDDAMASFRSQLEQAGRSAIEQARAQGRFAMVLASRPYHNDPLVNHDLPQMFSRLGLSVLPPDAVPGVNAAPGLERSRLDVVNNFHARMLGSAIIAAQDDALEYTQLVSFGCGHDAYLTDEIIRLMGELGDKRPLVLKVDESDISGPLGIRVRSFVETVRMRRIAQEEDRAVQAAGAEGPAGAAGPAHVGAGAGAALAGRDAKLAPTTLPDPYPQKFTKGMRREKVLLVPNTSHAFARLMAAVFSKQGVRSVAMPVGREEAIRLGKKYVHNDICFPAQIVIGEALAELESGAYDDCDVAVATGKYIGDCRLTHYAALLRKALDDAGYAHVPIVTNDDVDSHDIHPGFIMSTASAIRVAMALPMIDALEELLRKIRPYELAPGSADAAFEAGIDAMMDGLERHGTRGLTRGFKQAVGLMQQVRYDRSNPRPTVLIVGEYLLNFHPGANHDIEAYLEANGFEVVEAKMTDVIRKSYFYQEAQVKEYGVRKPLSEATWLSVTEAVFEHAHNVCDRIARAHPLYEPPCRMPELVQASDAIIHHTFDAGEGVLIPAEIVHHAERGCQAFLILQPFGCLPNHIVGRGIAKRLKELYPHAQILPLDYDPDVSFANLENRLQMLIMNAQAKQEGALAAGAAAGAAAAARKNAGAEARPGAAADGLPQLDDLPQLNAQPTPELAALSATAYDLTEISTRVAACATEVAAVAHEAAVLAEAAVERSRWDPARQRAWIEQHAEDAIEQMLEVSAQADEVYQLASSVLAAVRDNLAAFGPPAERLDELAQRAAELARQTSTDARSYIANAQERFASFMKARAARDSHDDALLLNMRQANQEKIGQMSERTLDLASKANALSRQARQLEQS